MAGGDTDLCGFMDSKLPYGRCSVQQRVKKRSLAPWKVWRRHWFAVRRLGPGQGIEILLDHGVGSQQVTDKDNCIRIPANALICRTESRTKHYAFGIFPEKERKPLIYLAANSEIETQRWMANLRQLLRPRQHRALENSHAVSMVDNAHSRSAGLTGEDLSLVLFSRLTRPCGDAIIYYPLVVYLSDGLISIGYARN